jgi:hypothetical protein
VVADVSDAPHLAHPVRLTGSGQLATVEEDSLDEVAQAIYWLASTEPGTVPDLPESGVPSPALTRGDLANGIADLLREQEPRAVVTVAREDRGQIDLDVALA